jgi:hypothetical protein
MIRVGCSLDARAVLGEWEVNACRLAVRRHHCLIAAHRQQVATGMACQIRPGVPRLVVPMRCTAVTQRNFGSVKIQCCLSKYYFTESSGLDVEYSYLWRTC